MNCVRIVYPKAPGSSFNWQHYYAVHLPLGLRLLQQYCGVTPARVEVDEAIAGPGGADEAPYHCICSLFFTEREHVDAMLGLFGIEEARKQLADDWPNYTAVDPELLVADVVAADTTTGQVQRKAAG